ncbi:hypothetical protein ACFOOK_07590 [Micromonospora krabiensis]|uniref:Uncharacterized protein n=1 Tax=Micromonospora krabiensis TaxID=307121 RepID=A0A1C3NC60_9ACTN|nr:hypothetical protein [Micromonospora krabiensis]SBV30139.1 hypothetical protein GA0070620_5732 [Micromonospora krabiensis]
MIYPDDKRVRYSPDLAVWVVDTGESHAAGADQILAVMMHYARQAGDMPEGCTCFPEVLSDAGPLGGGVQTGPPGVHRIGQRGGVVVYGHGTMPDAEAVAGAANAIQCPHANADGEEQARTLGKAGRWPELHALTVAFPNPGAATLQPAAPGSEAPAPWEGEPLTVRAAGVIPDRHVHPATRADLARLGALAAESARLDSLAREAKREADDAPAGARRQAAEAAAAGTPLDAEAVTRSIRERQEAAQAAQITADGTRDAVAQVRRQVVAGITERQAEWLSYLHGQAAHGLARLDLIVAELESALTDLAEIDRVRQVVESPTPGRLFGTGSPIAGNAVEAAREARQRAAVALAGLERHAAKVAAQAA